MWCRGEKEKQTGASQLHIIQSNKITYFITKLKASNLLYQKYQIDQPEWPTKMTNQNGQNHQNDGTPREGRSHPSGPEKSTRNVNARWACGGKTGNLMPKKRRLCADPPRCPRDFCGLQLHVQTAKKNTTYTGYNLVVWQKRLLRFSLFMTPEYILRRIYILIPIWYISLLGCCWYGNQSVRHGQHSER